MLSEDKIQELREQYQNFKRGNEDVFALKNNALSFLMKIGKEGDEEILEEIEDMLIDLEFYIAENRCNCHRSSSCYSSTNIETSQ